MSVKEKMTALADEIRKYGHLDYSMSIDEMTSAVSQVHEQGYGEGHIEGFTQGEETGLATGYTQGQTEERKLMYDTFQNNGNAQNYYYAFAANRFTDANYNPQFDIVCSNGSTTGQRIFYNATEITDTKVPIYANTNNADYCFMGATALERVIGFIVYESTRLTSTFVDCDSLKYLAVGGTIGQDIDTSDCPLVKESIESVYEHLSTTASGKTATFNKTAVIAAFGSTAAFDEYVASKPNWSYVLK